MTIHGTGMLLTLLASNNLKQPTGGPASLARGVGVLIPASWIIVLVYFSELVWEGGMPNPSTSYHFALMQYATVGSSFGLALRWRLLEGMLPIAGLMTFAWSTGVLFTLAQDFQSRESHRHP